MKYPYSTTHYYCGCHIVENKPYNVNLDKSIYCEDRVAPEDITHLTLQCLYLPGLRLRRVQAARRTP